MRYLLFLLTPALFGQAAMDGLNATAWVQTSVEYRATALQLWKLATISLPRALKDKKWTAALEQKNDFRKLPPAIIVDVDETVLDNSPGQARFLLEGSGRYDRNTWLRWTAEKKARGVPGAVEFLSAAAKRGVTVFYVTNRAPSEEADTRDNLAAQGFPIAPKVRGDLKDPLLLNSERPEWTSDKSTRRAAVAAHYRIIMLCGDDLNDFIPARVSKEKRDEITAPYTSWWGERWIVTPNPMYGSWEDTLFNFDRSLSVEDAKAAKLKALRRD